MSDDLTVFIPIYPNGLPTVPKLPRSSRAGSLRNPGFLYIKKFCDFESFTRFFLVRFQVVTCDRRDEMGLECRFRQGFATRFVLFAVL